MAEDVEPQEVEKPTSLSDKDRKWLLKTGKHIVRQFILDFPEQLPDAIILPETSACVLVDFFKPTIESLSKSKRTKKPKFYFYSKDTESNKVRESIRQEMAELGISNPSLVIFDDYASLSAKTIQRIRSEFEQDIPAYVLVGESYHYDSGYRQPMKIKVGINVGDTKSELSGGFDYRKEKVGSQFIKTGVNPLKEEMQLLGREIAKTI